MSKLRGVKPEKVEKRLKALFYGSSGVGKTTASIAFPRPYLIDTEKGSTNDQYVKTISKNGGVVFHTSDFDEVLQEVKTLLTEKHEFKTLIIDPLTILYNDLLDKASLQVGTEFGKHYLVANKKIKQLLSLLLKMDLNIILTCHAKNEYGPNMSLMGTTYDGYKKLDYLFDLVFEIQKRGKERVGLIKKSRIESFPDAEQFPFSYDEIASRYGKEILEKDAVPIQLAEMSQVLELMKLVDLLKIPEETTAKWLKKANSESFEDMPYEDIDKCIGFLKAKIQGEIK
jgi:ribosomal protein S24E